jgi:hypothetical protein
VAVGRLCLHADGDLGNPAILVVHRVPEQPQLRSHHIQIELVAVAETQAAAGRSCIEPFMRIGDFEPVVEAGGNPKRAEPEIVERDIGAVQVGAHGIACSVAGDERPGHQPAAARALHLVHA